jgi:hypothetical protein
MPTRTDKREDSFARARELVAETPVASLVAMLDNDAERDGTGPASEAVQVLVKTWLRAMGNEAKPFASRVLVCRAAARKDMSCGSSCIEL